MRQRPQWVLWRFEPKPDKPDELTKVPYSDLNRRAQANNPRSWLAFKAALARWAANPNGWAGIGFVLSKDDPFTGIDLDGCLDRNTGKVADWADVELALILPTYAEISPSGHGIKAFVETTRGHTLGSGKDGKENGQVEVYSGGRWFAVTGNAFEDAPPTIAKIEGAVIEQIIAREQARRLARRPQHAATVRPPAANGAHPTLVLADLTRLLDRLHEDRWAAYDDWLRIGMALHAWAEGDPHRLQTAYALYDQYSKERAPDLYGGTAEKWASFGKRSDDARPVTVGTLIEWVKQDSPAPEPVAGPPGTYQNGAVNRTTLDEPWGQIVHFTAPDLPPFPTDIFPDWLRAFVEGLAESTQTPRDLAGMLALSVLATCCQRWMMVKGNESWTEPVNVYTVTALPPASRKSAVFRALIAPLMAYEQRMVHEAKQTIAETAARKDIIEQRLDVAKRDAAKATKGADVERAMERVDDLTHELAGIVVPHTPRLIVDDVTPETLSTYLAEQGGRMAALSPEGDVFAIMAGRYTSGGPNFGVFLKAHAGDTLRVDRKTRSEFVDWPALTLGITTQPDVVRGLAEKAGFRGQGLLGRFLYALPESLVGRRITDPPAIPADVRATYHEHIAILLQWRESYSANCANSAKQNQNTANTANESLIDDLANIYLLSISPEGGLLLRDFLAWLEPHLAPTGAFGAFADWAGKLAGAVLRVAALLHIAREVGSHNSHNSQNEIDAETIADALRFAHYAIAHARGAFQEMGADPAMAGARRALRWLEQRGVREFTKRDLFEGIKGTIAKADDLDPILKILCDHGYIRAVEQERMGPGRKPSQRYDVHPMVATGIASQNSQNSHIPPFTFDLPVRGASTEPDVEVDMANVRLALTKGQEQSVRQQLTESGFNPDAVIARARAVPGYRAVEGFE